MFATTTRWCVSTFDADMRTIPTLLVAVVLSGALSAAVVAQRSGDNPREILDRAIDDFLAGRVTESIIGFDEQTRRERGTS